MMSDSNALPKRDESEDVKLIEAIESNGKTTVSFSRKRNTCDDRDNVFTVRILKVNC